MVTWGRNAEVLEAVGLSLLESAFPSLPIEAGRREASEKLWGRCGTELRAPRPFASGACRADGLELSGTTDLTSEPQLAASWTC